MAGETKLPVAGVQLKIQGYSQYIRGISNINRANKEAFSGKGMSSFRQELDKTTKKTAVAQKQAVGLKGAMMALGSGNVLGAVKALRMAVLSLQAAMGILLAIPIVLKLLRFGKASQQVALRNETLGITLQQMGKHAGYTADQIAYATQQLEDQGITTQSARQSLIRMSRANIEWSEASKLATIAQGAAVAAGMDSSAAFDRLILGIQKREPELLDELGINLRRGEAYKKLAAQMGKNVKELTEVEQQQAILNEIYAQSESVLGVYEAAMSTAGKQQGSMIRHIQQTQANLGNMLKPLATASTKLSIDFWKGARKATLGLQGFGTVLEKSMEQLGLIGDEAFENASIVAKAGEWIGKVWHKETQIIVDSLAVLVAVFGTIRERTKTGLFAPGFWEELHGNMERMKEEARRVFPDVYKDWEELGQVAEVSLDRANSAVDEHVLELEKMRDALQQQIAVLEKVEGIERNYNKAIEKAAKDQAKRLADLDKQLEKSKLKLKQKTLKAIQNAEKSHVISRTKLMVEHNREIIRREQDLVKERLRAQQRFELDRIQSLRRFKLQEKRLMAEGNILSLMELRENYDLEQKEAKENFDFSQKDAQEAAKEELMEMKRSLDERLREMDTNLAERRRDIRQSYDQELMDLTRSNGERRAEMNATYVERLEDLRRNRNEQLEELGRSLQKEAEITKEGMEEVAEKIADVFGDQGAADAIMEGWEARSQTAVAEWADEIRKEIEAIEAQMQAIEEGKGTAAAAASRGPITRSISAEELARRRYGMRTGGVGVVTGPALFEVEPGVQEMVAFAPVPQGSRVGGGRLDINVGGSIGFPDAVSSGASPAVIEAAVEQTLVELQLAVQRVAKW